MTLDELVSEFAAANWGWCIGHGANEQLVARVWEKNDRTIPRRTVLSATGPTIAEALMAVHAKWKSV